MAIRSPTPTPEKLVQIEDLKDGYVALHARVEALPPSRERALALTALEESSMWTTKAVLTGA